VRPHLSIYIDPRHPTHMSIKSFPPFHFTQRAHTHMQHTQRHRDNGHPPKHPPTHTHTHTHKTGRLSFLLACDLADAAAAVGAVLAVVKDDTRRQRQSEWFLEARYSSLALLLYAPSYPSYVDSPPHPSPPCAHYSPLCCARPRPLFFGNQITPSIAGPQRRIPGSG
jgi:hypothetical protein